MRGSVAIVVLAVLAIIGGGLFVLKPKVLHGDSRRANTSTETTEALVAAAHKQGAVAAASVAKIGEANATSPDSPEKQFIAREVPVALASLPPPDQTALIEAERRKVAVMEGRLAEAGKLYADALKRSDEYAREVVRATAAKRASDLELEQVAAERLGAERLMNWAIAVAVVMVGLYLYVKLTHLSPSAIAEFKTDIAKDGANASAALDSVTTRFQQFVVRTLTKLKS